MLYLKNSKGNEALGLVEAIFKNDLENRTSVLNSMLRVLRESQPKGVYCIGNGTVFLELLVAAEGLPFLLETNAKAESQEILKHYKVDQLQLKTLDSIDFALCSQLDQLNQVLKLRALPKNVLVIDVAFNRALWKSLKPKLLANSWKLEEEVFFSFFARLSTKGRLGNFFGRLDQSVLRFLIPSNFKKGIYLHLHHG